MKIKSALKIFFIVFSILVISGCGKEKVNLSGLSPDQRFDLAKELFDRKKFLKANREFVFLILHNPGNVIIERAQFYLAETYFNLTKYIMAIQEYEKLVRSLPRSSFVDDANYKIGLCYYMLSPGYALDQEYTYKAILKFKDFLKNYPDSDLKNEVEEKLVLCREKLAKKVYKTGELYRKMSQYRAAIISYNDLVENYTDSKFFSKSLYWIGDCNLKMDNYEKAVEAFQKLESKFPDTDLAKKAKEEMKIIGDIQN